MPRYFTIHNSSIGIKGGRYTAERPMHTAHNVAEKLFRNLSNPTTIHFCIRETTKNSKHKVYHYVANNSKHKITVRSDKQKRMQTGGGEII